METAAIDYCAQATARAEAREFWEGQVKAWQEIIAEIEEDGGETAYYEQELATAEAKLTSAQYLEQC